VALPRLAVLVTLVLLLPDVWILLNGEALKAVAVLMVMHLAIAVVTYNALVRIAPTRHGGRGVATSPGPSWSTTVPADRPWS